MFGFRHLRLGYVFFLYNSPILGVIDGFGFSITLLLGTWTMLWPPVHRARELLRVECTHALAVDTFMHRCGGIRREDKHVSL